MEKKYIVTITREFGSMGRPIARRLSELLNVEFYDRDIVEETARQMNLPLSVVSTNEESQGGIYAKMKSPLGKFSSEKQNFQSTVRDHQKAGSKRVLRNCRKMCRICIKRLFQLFQYLYLCPL